MYEFQSWSCRPSQSENTSLYRTFTTMIYICSTTFVCVLYVICHFATKPCKRHLQQNATACCMDFAYYEFCLHAFCLADKQRYVDCLTTSMMQTNTAKYKTKSSWSKNHLTAPRVLFACTSNFLFLHVMNSYIIISMGKSILR